MSREALQRWLLACRAQSWRDHNSEEWQALTVEERAHWEDEIVWLEECNKRNEEATLARRAEVEALKQRHIEEKIAEQMCREYEQSCLITLTDKETGQTFTMTVASFTQRQCPPSHTTVYKTDPESIRYGD